MENVYRCPAPSISFGVSKMSADLDLDEEIVETVDIENLTKGFKLEMKDFVYLFRLHHKPELD